VNCGDNLPGIFIAPLAMMLYEWSGEILGRDQMSGVGDEPSAERRRVLVGRLVEHYQTSPDPDKWLQEMTLQALRALDRSGLEPAEKSPARREIHAIHREVATKARAAKLAPRTAGIVDGGGSGSGVPGLGSSS
jgi:hypothetical protein